MIDSFVFVVISFQSLDYNRQYRAMDRAGDVVISFQSLDYNRPTGCKTLGA